MTTLSQHLESPPCQVAVLTPHGRGAVASLVVFGPLAVTTVERLFVPATPQALQQFPANRILYGRWMTVPDSTASEVGAADGEDERRAGEGEELVVVRRDPQSVEVHCHGGQAAVERIAGSLATAGCPLVPAATWLAQQDSDALVAEARLAIAGANTCRVATLLLDQVQGCLSRAVREILQCTASGDGEAAARCLQALLEQAPLGMRLTVPWRIAIVGPPNVGKSSLINAVLGYRRALVSETAGTTRDILTDVTAIDGWPVELADTAGLRPAASGIEAEGIRRAQQHAASTDLVLLVTDLSEPWTPELQQWVDGVEQPHLLVHNKCDLVATLPDGRPPGLMTSARTLQGVDELVTVISQRLVPSPPPPGAAIPFRQHHQQTLRDALAALRRGDLAAVDKLLSRLLTNKDRLGPPDAGKSRRR